MKKLIKPLILLLICFLIASCSKQKQTTIEKDPLPSQEKKIKIGFSIDTLAIERWQRDLDVFMNKAKELGADVIVQNAGNSVEEQNRQLMYLMDHADVIVVLPKEAGSISESIQKIRAKGIPVISYDRLTLNADINLYITIDSEKVGEAMASNMMRHTNGTNWYCILGPKEDFNMHLIDEGITRIVRNSKVKINHMFYTDNWNYDLASQEMVRLLQRDAFPDAIICGNDALAASIIQTLAKYYPDVHIPICGQDADIVACQYIVQGKQNFTIYKPIIKLAEISAEVAVSLAKNEFVIDNESYRSSKINNGFADITTIWLEPTYVDKYNLDKIVIDSGFHNKTSIYGN